MGDDGDPLAWTIVDELPLTLAQYLRAEGSNMAAKKKARKKKAATKRRKAPNPLTARLECKPVMKVESGTVYLVKVKGEGKGSVEVGHVTAKTEAEAKRRASTYVKRLL